MDSIFGRKRKGRQSSISDLNEVSVPYDKLAPAPRSPIPVGTVSQLRGPNFISAPITNPTLTTNGTELNKFAIQRSRAEREKLYDQHYRPPSPSLSSDSSTLYNDSQPSSSQAKLARARRSEASSSSSTSRSPSISDFGHFPPNSGPSNSGYASATIRPTSTLTTRSERSDGGRSSRHVPSIMSADLASQISHFYHPHRTTHSGEEVSFQKPATDEEIEALFDNVRRTRDLGDLPNMTIEQKWRIVYNDWQIRWMEEKARDDQTRKLAESGQPNAIMPESPEWYVKKFLDKTITAKQAGSLLVSLRSKEVGYVLVDILWFNY